MKYHFTEMCKGKIKIQSEKFLIFEKSFNLSAGNIDYANENRLIRKQSSQILDNLSSGNITENITEFKGYKRI